VGERETGREGERERGTEGERERGRDASAFVRRHQALALRLPCPPREVMPLTQETRVQMRRMTWRTMSARPYSDLRAKLRVHVTVIVMITHH